MQATDKHPVDTCFLIIVDSIHGVEQSGMRIIGTGQLPSQLKMDTVRRGIAPKLPEAGKYLGVIHILCDGLYPFFIGTIRVLIHKDEEIVKLFLEGAIDALHHQNIIISAEEANKLEPSKVCLLCTGSQGEPLAALSRIASGSHKQIKLSPNDIVIFSSSPIPGNAASVSKTINKLYLKGVKVYTNGEYDIHSSGHANQEELKLMLRLFQPEYFAPYHGEYRMLKTHTDLAIECGISKSKTFVLNNGNILSIGKDYIKKQGHVQSGEVYVDGSRIGDVSNIVIKDRTLMSNNGILAIIINIDSKNKTLLNTPLVSTRGYILVNESNELIKNIEYQAKKIITKKLKQKTVNFNDIKNEVINGLMPMLSEATGRIPIILPIIMDIKDHKIQTKTSKTNS